MSTEQQTSKPVMQDIVALPSRGLLYAPETELAKGEIKMKYMTAKEEDILTNESFIRSGKVFDELFKSLILSDIRYDDMLITDRNAIMVAARILSYGPHYEIEVDTPSGNKQTVVVDLRELKPVEFDETAITPGENKFSYETSTGDSFEFKLLTVGDEAKIEKTIQQLKKVGKSAAFTSRLRHMITGVNGDTSPAEIKRFVEDRFLVSDTRDFRAYLKKIQPNINFNLDVVDEVTGDTFQSRLTFGQSFFWVDA